MMVHFRKRLNGQIIEEINELICLKKLPLENFYLPFSGELNPENRWVKLSKIIPWDVIEEKYASLFAKSGQAGENGPWPP